MYWEDIIMKTVWERVANISIHPYIYKYVNSSCLIRFLNLCSCMLWNTEIAKWFFFHAELNLFIIKERKYFLSSFMLHLHVHPTASCTAKDFIFIVDCSRTNVWFSGKSHEISVLTVLAVKSQNSGNHERVWN